METVTEKRKLSQSEKTSEILSLNSSVSGVGEDMPTYIDTYIGVIYLPLSLEMRRQTCKEQKREQNLSRIVHPGSQKYICGHVYVRDTPREE